MYIGVIGIYLLVIIRSCLIVFKVNLIRRRLFMLLIIYFVSFLYNRKEFIIIRWLEQGNFLLYFIFMFIFIDNVVIIFY